MTQHILMIWMATAVATFSGLVGCTTKARLSFKVGDRIESTEKQVQDFNAAQARIVATVDSLRPRASVSR